MLKITVRKVLFIYSFYFILFFCSIALEIAMSVLILVWLCGHLCVRYSQGYVGQRCYSYHNCENNERCDGKMWDEKRRTWGQQRCQCESYHREVGKWGENTVPTSVTNAYTMKTVLSVMRDKGVLEMVDTAASALTDSTLFRRRRNVCWTGKFI